MGVMYVPRPGPQLPDGRVIKFGGERFEAPEALFNPYVQLVPLWGVVLRW